MAQSVITSDFDQALASLKAQNEANDAAFNASLNTMFAAATPAPEPAPEPTNSALPKHAYGAFRQRLRTALSSSWGKTE